MRVHMTAGYVDTSVPGHTTTYHTGHGYNVDESVGTAMREAGVCLLADQQNNPVADPEPEPDPEAEPEAEPPEHNLFDPTPNDDEDDDPMEDD